MIKNKLLIKKPNKLLSGRNNYFVGGGELNSAVQNAIATSRINPSTGQSATYTTPGFAPEIQGVQSSSAGMGNTPTAATTESKGAGIGNLAGGIASLAGQATSDIIGVATANKAVRDKANAMIGNVRNSMVAAQGKSDSFDQLSTDWNNMRSLRNVSKYDLGYQKAGKFIGSSFQAAARGGAAGASLGPWGVLGGAIGGQLSSIFKSGITNRAAKKNARRVNAVIQDIRDYNNRAMANRATNIMTDTMSNLNANYAAYGGSLDFGDGAIGYNFMDRYLTQKEDAAMNKNYSLGALPNTFNSNLNAFGGELNTQGADFTNGLLHINNGGSHESNPLEGVPMGVDQEGTPNLVEEGETVFNDYVFSKRLKVPGAIRKKYKLRDNISFADASKELSKESEERPNDPISQNGLEFFMAELANAQEGIREADIQKNQFSYGGLMGNIYAGPGRGSQTLNFNNSTSGLYFGESPDEFNPYDSNGMIDWNIMYGENSPYTWRRKYVLDHWNDAKVQSWLDRYVEGVNKYNSTREGYQPMTKSDITRDIFEARTWDKHWGAMHAGIDYAGAPNSNLIYRHMLRNPDGAPTAMPESDIWYEGTKDGYNWTDRYKDQYTRANNGAYEETTADNGDIVRTYYYDPVKKEADKISKYYYNTGTRDNPNYVEYTDENAPVWMRNNKYFFTNSAEDGDVTSYFYDPQEKLEQGKYADWLRYAPVLGFGLSTLTDGLGWTNKPDYGNADAVLEATRGAGTYQPVRFNPIGNYLTYNPFDRNKTVNDMNAEAAASRRALTNAAVGNRGSAMAGILAADNNYLNQLGNLAIQSDEYNDKQRQMVEDFNRNTNITNSQGILQADMANQKAQAEMRDFNLRGTLAAAQMKEAERQVINANKGANVSGLFQSIGDIGFEEYNAKMRDWSITHGIYGPGVEDYGRVRRRKATDATNSQGTVLRAANGGKIKRKKKGLTF